MLTALDLHLLNEGTHYRLYRKLGAHPITHRGVEGISFAVWAPNAQGVSIIGSFNEWDPHHHRMEPRGTSGVWELFVPELEPGHLYKFKIRTRHGGASIEKADPFGFAMELSPQTASIIWNLDRYRWDDEEWMAERESRQSPDAPISIYEVHLGSWRRHVDGKWFSYRELARTLIPYVKKMGYTHIQVLPILEHPFDGSWGYQVVGYYAPTSRFGTPDDFRYFVETAHQAGLGVILDWVPGHFPKDAHGLSFFDGTHLYEHEDPKKGHHPDWDTSIFNFGRPEVCSFLYSNALFWLDQYHIDGFRVDAVASMLYLDYSRKEGEWSPNEFGGRENLEAVAFLKKFNYVVHRHFPDAITIAEESTAWPKVSAPVRQGGLGFDYKWNMGWMHDTLEYAGKDPVYRRFHQSNLTFSLMYAFSENFVLPLSHDEVVHGKRALIRKMPGDTWRKFANLRALFGYMFGHPGKKLLFMGNEFGQQREWHHDRQLDWTLLEDDFHRRLQTYVRDLNRLYVSEPALHALDSSSRGFEWIDFSDATNSIVSFIRRGQDSDDCLVVVANFTPEPHRGYRVGVPLPGDYRQLLNSDYRKYGGSGLGVFAAVTAEDEPWQDQRYSVSFTLPPLCVIFLKPATD